MKMKRLVLFLFSVFIISITQAQENPERYKIKTGASLHRTAHWKGPVGHVAGRLSLNYLVTKRAEVGVYGAYSEYRSDFDLTPDTPITTYGMELNYYLLLPFRKEKEHSWNLYVSGKFGGYYAFFPENMSPAFSRKHRIDYGAYLGMEYSILKYFTPYLEVGYGKLSIMELGLTFIF